MLNFDLEIVPTECDDQYGALSFSELCRHLVSDLMVLPTGALSTKIHVSIPRHGFRVEKIKS